MQSKPLFLATALGVCGSLFSVGKQASAVDAPFALGGDDTVAFVGNTFVERARLYGELETALQLAAGQQASTTKFRNLGWSGDSVFNDSRSYFEPPSGGRDRMKEVMQKVQPSVLFLAYGTEAALSVDQGWTNEPKAAKASGAGKKSSLDAFLDGYQQKIDRLQEAAGDNLREIVLLSPPPLENLGAPLPNHTTNNRLIASFRDGIRQLAETNDIRFIDLFNLMGGDDFSGEKAEQPLTKNGVHLNATGYAKAAALIASNLFGDAAQLDAETVTKLKELHVEKNRLFFHRWRPANETYLFLFRKHEQGQNAKEIPQFDPLIAAEEEQIAELLTSSAQPDA